ncbi:hypothetical protein [Devosia ginsengisoli]|uniref:hypothetical protein n=1 Tax=Devosia ginsengisoli TaxID=400770 RepID=UPI0026F22070|nr:hypothetical protein [Devosia ginsengisoli]MCR6671283.1 hypothetical protein [Devosia ginsengisoli]
MDSTALLVTNLNSSLPVVTRWSGNGVCRLLDADDHLGQRQPTVDHGLTDLLRDLQFAPRLVGYRLISEVRRGQHLLPLLTFLAQSLQLRDILATRSCSSGDAETAPAATSSFTRCSGAAIFSC